MTNKPSSPVCYAAEASNAYMREKPTDIGQGFAASTNDHVSICDFLRIDAATRRERMVVRERETVGLLKEKPFIIDVPVHDADDHV